jgi:UrcA family protein
MLTFTKAIAAFAVLTAAGNAAAQAAVDTDAPTIVVSFADLDIGSPAGLRALEGRLHAAASRLCVQHDHRPLQAQFAERRCLTMAMSSGQSGIDQSLAQRAAPVAERSKIVRPAR